jgi:16S rRNA (guanine(1405)-N(7))-methyltransferase
MDKLVEEIKKKKELKSISREVVKEQLQKYLTQNPKLDLNNHRSASYKQAIKEVRARLRKAYGLFRKENIEIVEDYDNVEPILEKHSSTRERLPHYSELYQKIFSITGKPSTILDLGCGINPLSIKFMDLKDVSYYAYDISEKEVELINSFFKEEKVSGKASVMDVSKVKLVAKLPKADVAFLFKITDILDQGKGHKKTEEVLIAAPAKFVVISFPTLTMSGKPMNAPRRKWMEWLCERLGYPYEVLEFSNEIFYVIRR